MQIDNSDVVLSFKLGLVALRCENFNLARNAFENTLEYSPRHWSSIKALIRVTYKLKGTVNLDKGNSYNSNDKTLEVLGRSLYHYYFVKLTKFKNFFIKEFLSFVS